MNAPDNLDGLDDVDLAALSTRVLHDIVAKMTPEDRQRYRDALDAADAPLRSFLGAALGTPETSPSAPGKKCATCRGAFSGMSWDTLCPSCWEENLRKDSAARRARVGSDTRKPDFARAEQVMQDYVADYEMCGEDALGQDARYIPNEGERVLIIDAIRGLLAEPEFIAALFGSQQEKGDA
ncbi:hypothetical protein LMG26690_01298 [Achromobacter animicus]|uniref:Uncharacterized protein n=1 Tax=Achromobacter animicus TaxID=1389935 RepID=A0A6S6ZDV8_9BURK|nr:hypothetical protein [Achromobacter animicus]CAB3675425.1 hypothetical protein LMG26690_01298 [Achromobacter animicus]